MFRQIVEYRANKVLYNFIASNHLNGLAILPANICHEVVDALKCTEMEVRYVDISPETFCMDEEEVMSLADRAQLVLYVHTYGVENDAEAFFQRIKEKNPEAVIVDDRCLCVPRQVAHSRADVALFSTGPKKMIDIGSGGLGYVDDRWNYENVHEPSGLLLDLEYGIDEKKLYERYQNTMAHKMKLNGIYRKLLPERIQLPQEFQQWRFNIWVEDKERVLQAVFERGLFASGHYKPMEPGFKTANSLYEHVINLFNDFYYTEDQAIRTCEVINDLHCL